MWRPPAVVSLLIEDIAGLHSSVGAAGDGPEAAVEADLRQLARARRRAALMVGLDWLAILILVLLRDPRAPLLSLGPTTDTVFTLGLLAVATHAGLRLGHLLLYRSIERACARMLEAPGEA